MHMQSICMCVLDVCGGMEASSCHSSMLRHTGAKKEADSCGKGVIKETYDVTRNSNTASLQ